jgi:hypothetical protein
MDPIPKADLYAMFAGSAKGNRSMRIRICNTTAPYFFTYTYSFFLFPEIFHLSVKFLKGICKMVSMWPSQMLSTCLIKKRLALIHPLLE